jgi:hypothetical protein
MGERGFNESRQARVEKAFERVETLHELVGWRAVRKPHFQDASRQSN